MFMLLYNQLLIEKTSGDVYQYLHIMKYHVKQQINSVVNKKEKYMMKKWTNACCENNSNYKFEKRGFFSTMVTLTLV